MYVLARLYLSTASFKCLN